MVFYFEGLLGYGPLSEEFFNKISFTQVKELFMLVALRNLNQSMEFQGNVQVDKGLEGIDIHPCIGIFVVESR